MAAALAGAVPGGETALEDMASDAMELIGSWPLSPIWVGARICASREWCEGRPRCTVGGGAQWRLRRRQREQGSSRVHFTLAARQAAQQSSGEGDHTSGAGEGRVRGGGMCVCVCACMCTCAVCCVCECA